MTEIKEMMSSGIRNFICRSMPGKTVRSGEAAAVTRWGVCHFFAAVCLKTAHSPYFILTSR